MMPETMARSSKIMLKSIRLIVVFRGETKECRCKNKFADLLIIYNITTEIDFKLTINSTAISNINQSIVLITGAASGIGRLLALESARKGASHVIVVDKNKEGGNRVCEEVIGMGGKAVFIYADLSSKDSISEALSLIHSTFTHIDILINNAGIVTGKAFIDHSNEEIERTINVNLLACMLLTKGILPAMRSRGSGHIVNIASSAGMAAHPKLSVYVASKWGVIGWSESLRLELEQEKTGIRVTTVTPYYIDTGMFSGVKSPIIPLLKPASVSKKIIVAIEKNKIFSRMPWIVYAIPFVKGIMPQRWFDFILGKVFRVYSSMDSFKG